VFGSVWVNVLCGISWFPFASKMFSARTRKPLTVPSVALNWKVIVLVPVVIELAGRFMVIGKVWNPPPMPPY